MSPTTPPPTDIDPDFMLLNAATLQSLVKQMQTAPEYAPTDVLYFTGYILAVPILLALAIEIALKAFILKEGKPLPSNEHKLLTLFESLTSRSKSKMIQSCSDLSPSFHRLSDATTGYNLHNILQHHNRTFVEWRYIHEGMPTYPDIPAMHAALTSILTIYGQTYNTHSSSND